MTTKSNLAKLMATASIAALLGSAVFAGGGAGMQARTGSDQPPTAIAPADNDVANAPKVQEQTGTGEGSRVQEAALEVESQAVRNGKVTIDLAWMPEAGFVALHEVQDGRLSPDAVGSAPLAKGDNEAVAIELDTDISQDTTLVAMLHRDTGEIGTYEFGTRMMDRDGPELIAGSPIAVAFKVMPQPAGGPTGGGDQSQLQGVMPTDDPDGDGVSDG